MTPIDLRSVAGRTYRLSTETGEPPHLSTDPWLLTLPGRYGDVYPHSAELLAVQARGQKRLEVAAIPGVQITQRGDTGLIAVFPLSLLRSVDHVVRLKRRRILTPEQRAAKVLILMEARKRL